MRLDPRTKLLILAVTSVSVFMNKSIAVECVLAGIPLVLLGVSGNLKRTLKYAAFFLTLLLIQLFIVPRLPVTFGGIVYMFAVYIRKLLPCFMLGSFLIATTSVSKFLAAITKLRLSKGLTIDPSRWTSSPRFSGGRRYQSSVCRGSCPCRCHPHLQSPSGW